ncbi:MAG: hypothetical protein JST30_00630 [Armatimonadetes bacterium]|nr:hypothetical protein [Armatimonadota bacterium]
MTATPQRQINLNVIGEAFNLVKDRWQPFVMAGLVAALAMGVIGGAVAFLFVALGLIGGDRPAVGLLMLPLMGTAYLVVLTLSAVFQAGLYNMALKAIRGETVEVSDVFVAMKAPIPFLTAGLIVGLATAIGMMLCYIPGFIVAGLTMFVFPLMIDKKLAPVDAIKESIAILKPQAVMAVVLFFLSSLVASIGAYACYIGIFFTMPIAMVSIALAYRDLVWQSPAPATGPMTAPAAQDPPAHVPTDYEVAQAESELDGPTGAVQDPETVVEPEASTIPHTPAPDDPEAPEEGGSKPG